MFKRLAAAAFVSVVTMVGIAPAASATADHGGAQQVIRAIDWH